MGYVYVAEFSDGVIKVGSSNRIKSRINVLKNNYRRETGANLLRVWISPYYIDYRELEKEFHWMFSKDRIPHKDEFYRIPFATAVCVLQGGNIEIQPLLISVIG